MTPETADLIGKIGLVLLGASLTLAGQLIMFTIQTFQKASEEKRSNARRDQEDRRENRRKWHDEAVDAITDLETAIHHLRAPIVAGVQLSDRSVEEINHEWRTTLRKRLDRIQNGHPDAKVRRVTLELSGHFELAVHLAHTGLRLGTVALHEATTEFRDRRSADLGAIEDAIWDFKAALHSDDPDLERPPFLPTVLQQQLELMIRDADSNPEPK